MKQKEIVTQIPEGFKIDKEKSTFEKIVLREIDNKYPLSVDEIKGRSWWVSSNGQVKGSTGNPSINELSTQARAEAFLALMQLVELRDACNEIDGGKNLSNVNERYSILKSGNEIIKATNTFYNRVLNFRKRETRDWFLETHRKLIETAKELL